MQKPKLDENNYKTIQLSNELVCLLVQDIHCDKASAALDVEIGSFSNDKILGLAHFLEHMLFLGTEKVYLELMK